MQQGNIFISFYPSGCCQEALPVFAAAVQRIHVLPYGYDPPGCGPAGPLPFRDLYSRSARCTCAISAGVPSSALLSTYLVLRLYPCNLLRDIPASEYAAPLLPGRTLLYKPASPVFPAQTLPMARHPFSGSGIQITGACAHGTRALMFRDDAY